MSVVYGHRGARGEAPENTLTGFRYALGLGVRAIEFDVRLSADGHLVIIHDETVDRTTNGSGRVADLTLRELRALDARAQHDHWSEPAHIPTLAEVLDATDRAAPALQIEVKRDAYERMERVCTGVLETIDRRRLGHRAVVSSFEAPALDIVRRMAPALRRAFITKVDPAGAIETAASLGCTQLGLQLAILSPAAVEAAHARGLEVLGWVANARDEIQRVLESGADGFTTDRPTAALELLART